MRYLLTKIITGVCIKRIWRGVFTLAPWFMRILRLIILLLFLSVQSGYLRAQGCTTLGQTPPTAFPICATDTFTQTTVPLCVNSNMQTLCSGGLNASYQDINPYWYKFTCYQSGTLGFLITPLNLNDDYDWMLFDVTGHDPMEVYTNTSLIVTYNWSGNSSLEASRGYTGVTGTSPTGTGVYICATNPQELGGSPPYSDSTTLNVMPQIIIGHNYLLMVSHFTQTQSGYKLSFGGGTGVIRDITAPAIKEASAFCDGEHLTVIMNKRLFCNSLAADGSDFALTPANATVTSAKANACSTGFDMDTILLTLSNTLPVGGYLLSMQNGTDGNTLLDVCENSVPVGDNVPITIQSHPYTPMDSITPVTDCLPNKVSLVFKDPMKCNSVAADGSDFTITGPSAVTITKATALNCVTDTVGNSIGYIIEITLSGGIFTGGTYRITLKNGTDGNTLLNECDGITPAGSFINFTVKQSVSAAFTYAIQGGCRSDTVSFHHDGAYGVNSWQWTLDNSIVSSLQNPTYVYSTFGTKQVTLIVSNGQCRDSVTQDVVVSNQPLQAAFTAPVYLCPEDEAIFQDTSIGTISTWQWSFGNGQSASTADAPPERYPAPVNAPIASYTVMLIVTDNRGCKDTAIHILQVPKSCYIAVPSAFTPNGDGLNDKLYPLNAYNAINLVFRVYNRFGEVLFETTDWNVRWNGNYNGEPQPSGTYVWTLTYTEKNTGKFVSSKGTAVLIR